MTNLLDTITDAFDPNGGLVIPTIRFYQHRQNLSQMRLVFR